MTAIFQALLAGGSGISSAWGGTMSVSVFPSAAACSISVFFDSDGVIDGASAGAPVVGLTDDATGTSWYLPNTVGIGAGYWIKGELTSGSSPNIGLLADDSTLYQLNSSRQWGYNSGTGGASSNRGGTIKFKIYSDAGGTSLVATGTFVFSAERES